MARSNSHSMPEMISVAVAVAIFSMVSFTFLFPCNRIIPLDRRTVAVVGALLCYLTRTFFFTEMNMLHAIDFNVLILLASIMVVNHIVVHLKETKKIIDYLQGLVKLNPVRGFWMISFAAFIVSPFLTNDGVCLLFVEPILNAFELDHEGEQEVGKDGESSALTSSAHNLSEMKITAQEALPSSQKLDRGDIIYFLLALACSANIGSQITYTGNPQNMLLSQDAISVMPSYKFFIYMLLPSTTVWLITVGYVYRCWCVSKLERENSEYGNEECTPEIGNNDITDIELQQNPKSDSKGDYDGNDSGERKLSVDDVVNQESTAVSNSSSKTSQSQSSKTLLVQDRVPELNLSLCACMSDSNASSNYKYSSSMLTSACNPIFTATSAVSATSPMSSPRSRSSKQVTSPMLSPRRRRRKEREVLIGKVVHVVSSPFPYMVLILLAAMIVMIFVDVMPISALICVSSMCIVVTVVLGNHWRHTKVWGEHTQKKHHRRHSQVKSALAVESRSSMSGLLYSTIYGTSSQQHVSVPVTADEPPKDKSSEEAEEDYPLTSEEKMENLNEFFEELFKSIDYSLLLIFLGTFIVVENMSSTGIPKFFWNMIVGDRPFQSFTSVLGISLFVLISSQLLGNVAVIQLAVPNIQPLPEATKTFAWAIVSFVATIGGNLTITGSAANIIVAEKAAKLDSAQSIDFFRHYRVCFWITLVSCVVGCCIITGILYLDELSGSKCYLLVAE